MSDKTKIAELRSRSSSTNSSQGESPVRGTRDPSPAQVFCFKNFKKCVHFVSKK